MTAGLTGYITRRPGGGGQLGAARQPLMMLVPLETKQLWVQANYKEPNSPTSISASPPPSRWTPTGVGRQFKGRVDSIMAGTGSAFSLLPPENATGNWVKVVQRIR